MRTLASAWILCLITGCTALCQTTSTDTLTAFSTEQLRTTARIFTEHRFLKEENRLLASRCAALQAKTEATEKMIAAYRETLAELERNRQEADHARDVINESLQTQLKQQQRKNRRRTLIGIVSGLAAGMVVGIII